MPYHEPCKPVPIMILLFFSRLSLVLKHTVVPLNTTHSLLSIYSISVSKAGFPPSLLHALRTHTVSATTTQLAGHIGRTGISKTRKPRTLLKIPWKSFMWIVFSCLMFACNTINVFLRCPEHLPVDISLFALADSHPFDPLQSFD